MSTRSRKRKNNFYFPEKSVSNLLRKHAGSDMRFGADALVLMQGYLEDGMVSRAKKLQSVVRHSGSKTLMPQHVKLLLSMDSEDLNLNAVYQHPLPKAPIKRLVKKQSGLNLGSDALNEIHKYLQADLLRVIRMANQPRESINRKTLNSEDVHLAIEVQ
jgi:histone H3/H4